MLSVFCTLVRVRAPWTSSQARLPIAAHYCTTDRLLRNIAIRPHDRCARGCSVFRRSTPCFVQKDHLSAVYRIAKVLTPSNCDELVGKVCGKSSSRD